MFISIFSKNIVPVILSLVETIYGTGKTKPIFRVLLFPITTPGIVIVNLKRKVAVILLCLTFFMSAYLELAPSFQSQNFYERLAALWSKYGI